MLSCASRTSRTHCVANVCSWGDQSLKNVPTVVLLSTASNAALFTYTTPGSMFGVDVLLSQSTKTQDTVLIAAAGKHVPANQFGNGGDAFAWSVTVST